MKQKQNEKLYTFSGIFPRGRSIWPNQAVNCRQMAEKTW